MRMTAPELDSSWRAGTCPMPQPTGVSARYPRGQAVPGVCQGRQGGALSSAEFQERLWQSVTGLGFRAFKGGAEGGTLGCSSASPGPHTLGPI